MSSVLDVNKSLLSGCQSLKPGHERVEQEVSKEFKDRVTNGF